MNGFEWAALAAYFIAVGLILRFQFNTGRLEEDMKQLFDGESTMHTKSNFFKSYAGEALTERHQHQDYFWPPGYNYVLIKGFLGDRYLELEFHKERPIEKYLPIGYRAFSREEYIELISRSDVCAQIRDRKGEIDGSGV